MSNKKFMTGNQLVKHLRIKGMDISKGVEGSKVKRILAEENYYNVINGYNDLFIDANNVANGERFKPGTSFEEVFALYNFDRNVRNIYLKFLLKVENKLKTVIAEVFSAKYGHDNYLVINNFDTNPNITPKNLQRIANKNDLDLNVPNDNARAVNIAKSERISTLTDLFGSIQKEVSKQLSKHNNCITHYMTKYGYVPLWVLTSILTFGKISDFYFNMKDNDKSDVGRHFSIQYRELHRYTEHLSIARNYCAHGNRFFDLKFKKAIRLNSIPNIRRLNLNYSNGNYLNGAKDIYSISIIFTRFLSKTDIREFVKLMDAEFTNLAKELHTVSIEDVMKMMGFHSDWKLITLII